MGKIKVYILALVINLGGGIKHLNAVELSTICTNPNSECKIQNTQYKTIENDNPFATSKITISTQLTDFINHSNITSTDNQTININNGKIQHLINHGNISGGIFNSGVDNALAMITNYGEMRGVWAYQEQNITINNLGIMKTAVGSYFSTQTQYAAHFVFENSSSKLFIKNFVIPISESQSEFNNFTGYVSMRNTNKNSHLLIYYGNVAFSDSNSKIILDFGGGFELGKEYKTAMLITKQDGTPFGDLQLDFSRLATRTSLYKLTQSGEYFIASIDAPNSEIGILHKSNVRTMNNFYTMSNSMVYPHKYKVGVKRATKKKRVIRRVKKVANLFNVDCFGESCNSPSKDKWVESSLQDNYVESHSLSSSQNDSNALLSSLQENERSEFSWQSTLDSPSLAEGARGWVDSIESLESLDSLESNESFSYKNNSIDSTTYTNQNSINRRMSQSQSNQTIPSTQSTPSNDNYYFILTPFVSHNYFFESGRYNLSGLEYGFLTAFSGKLTQSNALGTHFMMSYGSLGDSKDKDFSITNLNLNVGINYKFDMIWDMYLKARGDFFYFLNQVKTLTMPNVIKPNNFGFGVSVAYGKDFNFGNGGILGIEGGIDYEALQSSTIELHDNTYNKSLYNLIYVDLGLNYSKYFGNFGLNAMLGIKGNIKANKLATSKIHISTFNKSVDMMLDNDNFLGYANLGVSYVLQAKNFDMEFSLAYYGNFGDRVISNGGGVEWRVLF